MTILTAGVNSWNHPCQEVSSHSSGSVLRAGYGILRRDVRWLVPAGGVPQTSEQSPKWGSDTETEDLGTLRGGGKREAGQAPCGGDGISRGPSLCWWSSRALVSHSVPSPQPTIGETDQAPLGVWSFSFDWQPREHSGSLPRLRVNVQEPACKLDTFTHQLKTEM